MKQLKYIRGRVPDPRVSQQLDSLLDEEESGLFLVHSFQEISEDFGIIQAVIL